jgi:hypothetical protein
MLSEIYELISYLQMKVQLHLETQSPDSDVERTLDELRWHLDESKHRLRSKVKPKEPVPLQEPGFPVISFTNRTFGKK